ncbi:MAG TPA: type II toxin-antitoxin system prevent-host-death family antitoxin [Rhizomicrobium sp.]
MSTHTLDEAKDKLSELIDRAVEGEDVVITREGKVVARLNSVSATEERKITPEDVEWIRRHRVAGMIPPEDAGTFVSRMRDEDWAR